MRKLLIPLAVAALLLTGCGKTLPACPKEGPIDPSYSLFHKCEAA